MSDLSDLYHAHDKVGRARAESAAASYKLDLELIRERAAELRSQSDPIAKLLGLDILSDEYAERRKQILDCVFYVLIGRFPSAE